MTLDTINEAMSKNTNKRYACTRCGHCDEHHATNHFGPTFSLGRYSACSNCPPWAKYPEMGGGTTWVCVDAPEHLGIPRVEDSHDLLSLLDYLESEEYERRYEFTVEGLVVWNDRVSELWVYREDPPASNCIDWPAGGAFEFVRSQPRK